MKHIPEAIQLAGFDVVFTRKPVRNINLRIDRSTGEVRISAPRRVNLNAVEAFVASKSAWIKTAQKRIRARPAPLTAELANGAEIHFFDETLVIDIEIRPGTSAVQASSNQLLIGIPKALTNTKIKDLVENFYRSELNARVPDLLDIWQPQVGAVAKKCKVRRMKSRWGSCNVRTASILLSLELAKYPQVCLEYVLVHELTHLLEASHNKRFHQLVANVMPDWKQRKALLGGRIPTD